MAIRTIPMPPSHCRIERQSRMPGGAVSRPVMTVEPVVVMPETASKNASVKLMFSPASVRGREAKRDRPTQLMKVIMKAWRRFMVNSRPALLRIKDPPKKAVMTIHRKKTFQSGLPQYISASIGMIMPIDRMESKIP